MKRPFFHLSTYLAVLACFGHAVAQTDLNIAPLKRGMLMARPHVDALRQTLGLSTDLELQWRTSRTGGDTLSVTDNFNRTDLGPNWALDSRYWGIKNGELVLNSGAIYEWRYLAVFTPIFNNVEREVFMVTYKWGKNADAVGIGEGAHALMIDSPSSQGSGYWLWRRTNQNSVWLYAIKNGSWEYTPGESKEFQRADAHRPIPQGGDVIAAVIRNESHAVFFDYYVNDRWDATLHDGSKEFAQNHEWYTGVFIHGQDLNNQVDDFTVWWLGNDTYAPAPVSDLRAIDSSAASVKLEWTAPGDNHFDGQADHYEIRYDTKTITASNFASAKLAANIPAPVNGGEVQQFVVTGLQKDKKYYFALRTHDEANNVSTISNVATATTKESLVATALELVSGCNQTGAVGEKLSQPLVVRVDDQNRTPFSGYAVTFAIKNGEARFANNATELSVNTDSNGRASAEITLGATTGEIAIEISASGLSNSPMLCIATAKAAAAAEIVQVSGDQQLLSAGEKAAPLIVRVTDQYGNSSVKSTVTFAIIRGGGNFANGQASFENNTDDSGLARAELFASETAGDTTVVAATVSANLQTSFSLFAAAAESLQALSGDEQVAPVKSELDAPIVVRVLDALGAPVKSFPVLFEIVAGGGVFANNRTRVTISTNEKGEAATKWTMGATAGVNQAQASHASLSGSPIIFNATAEAVSSVAENVAAVPKEFALLPNSPNPFNPETTIRFALPEAAEVTLALFDANGRLVRHLINAALPAGVQQTRWDGRAANGRSLDSGVYFCRMIAVAKRTGKRFEATRKLVLTK